MKSVGLIDLSGQHVSFRGKPTLRQNYPASSQQLAQPGWRILVTAVEIIVPAKREHILIGLARMKSCFSVFVGLQLLLDWKGIKHKVKLVLARVGQK